MLTQQPTTSILLPHKFDPRPYQLPFLAAMDQGYTRAVCIWHRRAGKDKCFCNFVAKKMMERVGAYYYIFPTYSQGRKALWENYDKSGFRLLDHFPKPLRYRVQDQEMLLQFIHPSARDEDDPSKPAPGSIMRVVGSDNIDSVMGTNPIGLVFSEYSLQDPRAWDFMRPILAENGGWAIFNFTPRGKNHGYQLFQTAKKHPGRWFLSQLTVDDTHAVDPKILAEEREELMEKTGSDAHYMQEYYVSFDAPVQGAYFGKQLMDAEKAGRITSVPHDPRIPVDTFWDLGHDDTTAIWFVQTVGREIRAIDYLETNGEGLAYYAQELQKKPYTYGTHYFPHDGNVTEIGSGLTRRRQAEDLGLKPIRIVPRTPMKDLSIQAARVILPRMWFDEVKTLRGLNALRSYEKEFDEKNHTYKNHPLHNWASNGADSFQQLAMAYRDPEPEEDDIPTPDIPGMGLWKGRG